MQKISVNSEKKLITIISYIYLYTCGRTVYGGTEGGGSHMYTATSFKFWKTTGSKTKSGNIKAIKPQNIVIINVPSGQVVFVNRNCLLYYTLNVELVGTRGLVPEH